MVISTILIIIGVQIIGLLKDAKESLKKADTILEDLGFLSRSLTRGSSTLSHVFTSLESGLQLVGMVTKLIAPKGKK